MIATDFINDDSCARHRQILLRALSRGPVNTIEAREKYGIASPAPRVLELRRSGCDIRTTLTTVNDAAGRIHRVASYRFFPKPVGAAQL